MFKSLDPVAKALDFGFVVAAKTGCGLQNTALSSRRIFFEWNDPWTRFHGAKMHSSQNRKSFSALGSISLPFGSQTLPLDL
jgi:hypothetical protein